MLRIPCPWCSPCDEPEFRSGGEVPLARPDPPEAVSEDAWAEYLFMRDNPMGFCARAMAARAGLRQWFIVVRSTVTHEIRATARFGEPIPEIDP